MENPGSASRRAFRSAFHHHSESAVGIAGRHNSGAVKGAKRNKHRPSVGEQVWFKIDNSRNGLEIEVVYAELNLVVAGLRNGGGIPRCQGCVTQRSSTVIGENDASGLPSIESI